jgi:hypothetical protein
MLRDLKNLFNIKVILGGIIFAVGVFAVFVVILWFAKAKGMASAPATAILNVIKAPTETQLSPVQTRTPEITLVPSQKAPPPSADIALGDYVQVTGTGGDGLRLHKTAGVSSEVPYVAIEAEVFVVKDGPIEADGYVWWMLQDPYSENTAGWGVSNYLAVVKIP